MEHIEQLSAETEEVTAFIEEALELNKKNKENNKPAAQLPSEKPMDLWGED